MGECMNWGGFLGVGDGNGREKEKKNSANVQINKIMYATKRSRRTI